MKNFKTLLMLVLAGGVMASCQKEQNVKEPLGPVDGGYEYCFAAELSQTKSELSSDAQGHRFVSWEDGDKIGVFTSRTGVCMKGDVNVSASPVLFSFTSTAALASGDKVYTFYPYAAQSSGNPRSVSMSIPVLQNGNMEAMPMVGVPYALRPEDIVSSNARPLIKFVNLGAIWEFKVYSGVGKYSGEKLQSVRFTSESNIAGRFSFDVTQSVTELSSLSCDEKTITLSVPSVEVTSSKDAAQGLAMVVAPNVTSAGYTGNLVITTNRAIYKVEVTSPIVMERNHVRVLNVNLDNAQRELRGTPVAVNPSAVGNSYYTSGFNTAWSQSFEIPVDRTLHLEFKNYTNQAQNWHNWILGVTNAQISDASWNNDAVRYFALRPDNYGWGNAQFNAERISVDYAEVFGTNEFWPQFRSFMHGAEVVMEIEHASDGMCRVDVKTTKGGKTISQSYSQTTTSSASIWALISPENARVEITRAMILGGSFDPADPGEDDEPVVYNPPTYADDYRAIQSWAQHGQWNLANTHDPSVAYYDGYYYMYCTDASYGNQHLQALTGKHFSGKRSRDLVNWEYVPGPFNDAPSWVNSQLNSIRSEMGLSSITIPANEYNYWAPVIRTVNVRGQDILRMYYCIVLPNTHINGNSTWVERAFIGMCETTDPASGNWIDKGYVICSSSDRGTGYYDNIGWESSYFYFNAIDPTYFVTPQGKHYLVYGSWHSGFACVEIDPLTGKTRSSLGNPWASNASALQERYGKRVGARTNSRWQASEAPEVIYKDGYYYMFMAYDELNVAYNTRVVRSTSPEGPYFDIDGRNCTNAGGDCFPIVTHPYKFGNSNGWVGISHCAVFKHHEKDQWFYASQGRLPAHVNNALMMGHVRQIVWCPASPSELDNLWPIALPERYGAVPDSKAIKSSELVGTWAHINLSYSQANQQGSTELRLNADGSMSGALSGKWSYDEATGYLTLGDVIVCVKRELDWEANPRVPTIVYAGTAKGKRATYWGKKI